ncbi:acyl-CoA dehydrogenase family protein [Amycolatopsis sp. PS_44_ISF1]|uniref:acyl-CoA dehydrogenase family protein n=1 Tax=Amycolatopsis sp. PS_44_ISF1 TaxID=2974917 RepID=UPI0028DFF957|nr:acyl-CoA dehydrogenase family protein [Amycolatopsis sp. PS_44_ISF1]MDT8912567.1 acyl-CoA dehydrogenase family protein [Amycolatopsis sp. PS_44_ISF1]
MNLEFNEDQRLLFETVDAAVGRGYPAGGRAAATGTGLGWNAKVWSTLGELGLTGLTVAEDHDGVGAGPVEVYATLEAMGKHAAAEPLLDGVFLPSWLIAALGTAEQAKQLLPELAGGGTTIAVAHAEPGRPWGAARAVTATAAGTLTGVKAPVRHADQAGRLLVTATAEDGRTQVYLVDAGAEGSTRTDGRSADWSHASQVEFADTPAVLLGTGEADAAAGLATAFARARVAVTGEAIGLMETGLALTVEYLKTRKQFGVPLASFQALVHRAADLYAKVELARSMALWATAALEARDNGAEVDLGSVADDAFVFVADAATTAAEEIVQLHGGIGMTYESEVGHHAARLTAITESFGGVDAARRRALASDALLDPPSALLNNAEAVTA